MSQDGGQPVFNRITQQCDRLDYFCDRLESWASTAPSPIHRSGASEASLRHVAPSPSHSSKSEPGRVQSGLSDDKASDAGRKTKKAGSRKAKSGHSIAEAGGWPSPGEVSGWGPEVSFGDGAEAAGAWPAG